VDWIHPSVRDLVIDYLVEHDAERRSFLSTTTPAGLILALSTGGGATGQRQFPLLVAEADWEVVTTRLGELISTGTPGDQLGLARGVLAPLSTRMHLAEGDVQRLRELAGGLQGALRTNWDDRPAPVGTAALSAYYETSILIGELSPSPHLAPTWNQAVRRAVKSVREMGPEEGAFNRVDALLRLASVLKDNEPRFLKIVKFPLGFARSADALVRRMQAIMSNADELDEDEVVEEDDGEGHTFAIPVEPDPSEYEALQWFTEAIASAEAIINWFPGHEQLIRTIIASCEDHHRRRERRQERWEEWRFDQRGDEHDEEPRRYGTGPQFDIDEFFADL
jgi:hypothetical protein